MTQHNPIDVGIILYVLCRQPYSFTPAQVLAEPLGNIAAMLEKPKEMSVGEAERYAKRRAKERSEEQAIKRSLETGEFWKCQQSH